MKQLRKTTKSEVLVSMFPEVGDSSSVADVCAITGISSYDSLKAICSYIRHAKHIPDENRIDIRIDDGMCVRVA